MTKTFAMLGLLGSFAASSPAWAAVDFITNGNFEQTSATQTTQIIGSSTVTGWTNASTSGYTGYGYNFITKGDNGDKVTGVNNNAGGNAILYGPDNGTSSSNYSNNGLTASPNGGNFVFADGDTTVNGALSQTIQGLTVGTSYLLSFYWAGAQMSPVNNSSTTEAWKVTFGGATLSTNTITTTFKGFTPWVQATMLFTATATTQLLSFLAVGAPNGEPPTALLDGVSLVAAPEPASWLLMVVGMAGIAAVSSRARRSKMAKTA